MKILTVLLAPALSMMAITAQAAPPSQSRYDFPVTGIYDGDTFYIEMPGLPPELRRLGVRVRGIDTPEMHGKCEAEVHNALAAKAFTTRVLLANGNRVTLQGLRWDKYGGRVDADVYVAGQKLGDMMITRGYARPYSGGKRAGWCGPND
jgi:micrococcal nuclease